MPKITVKHFSNNLLVQFCVKGSVFNAGERINIASGCIGIPEGHIHNAADALTLYRDTLALQGDTFTMRPTH